MRPALSPLHWWHRAKREWLLFHLAEPEFAFMYDPPPLDEWVSLDCETTGLDIRHAEIISIGAVRIVGDTIMTSERLELLIKPEKEVTAESVRVHRLRQRDLAEGIPVADAMRKLMRFIGSRPLVGYYLEFDVAMLDRAIWPMLGLGLPQKKIEVSSLYYDLKFRALPPWAQQNPQIDLGFATMMADLQLPTREAHDALNDAVMTAMAFIKLRRLRDAS